MLSRSKTEFLNNGEVKSLEKSNNLMTFDDQDKILIWTEANITFTLSTGVHENTVDSRQSTSDQSTDTINCQLVPAHVDPVYKNSHTNCLYAYRLFMDIYDEIILSCLRRHSGYKQLVLSQNDLWLSVVGVTIVFRILGLCGTIWQLFL